VIRVIDDFLSEDEYQAIHDTVTSLRFPWVRANILHDPDDPRVEKYNEPYFTNDVKFNIQFVHNVFYKEYRRAEMELILGPLAPLLKKLNINKKNLLRCKINLNPYQGPKHIFSGWHTDNQEPNGRTAIYYVNTNNGYTAYKDPEGKAHIMRSKANRLFTFPSLTPHAGVIQTDHQYRCLININWLED